MPKQPIFTTLPKPEKVEPFSDKEKRLRRTAIIGGLAVAGAATTVGLSEVLNVRARLVKQSAERVEKKDLGQKLKTIFQEKAAQEVSALKHPPFAGSTIKDVAAAAPKGNIIPGPGNLEHEYTRISHNYHTRAREKHAQLAMHDPALKDWKYYVEPHDAEHPPKPGKYVTPEIYDRKVTDWRRREEKKRLNKHIAESRAAELRDSITKMERILHRRTEFGVTLKEGRDQGGKFSSNDSQTSPLDMQAAYHAPVVQNRNGKFSLGKAAAVTGGAALGLGYLGFRAPALRNKILGKSVQAGAEEASGVVAAPKLLKGTREALDFKHNEQITAMKTAAEAKTKLAVSQIAQEAQRTQAQLKNQLTNAKLEGKAHLTVRRDVEGELAREKEAHNVTKDTLAATTEAVESKLGGPVILDPQGKAADPVIRAAHERAKSIIVQGEKIQSVEGAHDALRRRLLGDNRTGRKGLLSVATEKIAKHAADLDELTRTGATSFQIDKKKADLVAARVSHKNYARILSDLDAGALTHAGIMEHLDPLVTNEARRSAKESLNKEITGVAKSGTAFRKQARKDAKQKAIKEADEKRKIRDLTKSDPGYPGHDYHGKAPKSKGPKNFSDARLATRLCSALQNVPRADMHEFSSFVRDIEVKHLPSNVQKEIGRFVKVKPGMKVSHYSMTASELMGKADPHNMATARLNVEKSMSQKAARAEVHARREHKMVLLMNDKMVDGHHFTGKADYGKVSSSLHVIDLTPTRFQMEALRPGMIELSLPEGMRTKEEQKHYTRSVGQVTATGGIIAGGLTGAALGHRAGVREAMDRIQEENQIRRAHNQELALPGDFIHHRKMPEVHINSPSAKKVIKLLKGKGAFSGAVLGAGTGVIGGTFSSAIIQGALNARYRSARKKAENARLETLS